MHYDPFPGDPYCHGTWNTIRGGRRLIYLGTCSSGEERVLEWNRANGDYRLWRYDRRVRGAGDPLAGDPVAEGRWDSIVWPHRLLYLCARPQDPASPRTMLAWSPDDGWCRVWGFDMDASGGADPLAGPPLAECHWNAIRSGHELVYLGALAGEERVLDWEPGSGRCRIWRYDRGATGDPFPGAPLAEGTWNTVGPGHTLVSLGDVEGEGRVLDWEPTSGRYRIWRCSPGITRDHGPFPGDPVSDGRWSSIGAGHELVYLGDDPRFFPPAGEGRVLDWEPGSGDYRVWQYQLDTMLFPTVFHPPFDSDCSCWEETPPAPSEAAATTQTGCSKDSGYVGAYVDSAALVSVGAGATQTVGFDLPEQAPVFVQACLDLVSGTREPGLASFAKTHLVCRYDNSSLGTIGMDPAFSWEEAEGKVLTLGAQAVGFGASPALEAGVVGAVAALRDSFGAAGLASALQNAGARAEALDFSFDGSAGSHTVEIGCRAQTSAESTGPAAAVVLGQVREIRVIIGCIGPFVGHINNKQVHHYSCTWANAMLQENRVPFEFLSEALEQGYDRCHYCLGD